LSRPVRKYPDFCLLLSLPRQPATSVSADRVPSGFERMSIEENQALKNLKITRSLPHGKYKLREVFSGLEASPFIRRLFEGEKELEELQNLDVEITVDVRYMRVSDIDGKLLVGSTYLRRGRREFIYLDLIHELTHIKQLHHGYDIYDPKYSYVKRPTELEAYANAVAEARRIGLSDLEIYEYLRVDWISEEELEMLAERLGVAPQSKGQTEPKMG